MTADQTNDPRTTSSLLIETELAAGFFAKTRIAEGDHDGYVVSDGTVTSSDTSLSDLDSENIDVADLEDIDGEALAKQITQLFQRIAAIDKRITEIEELVSKIEESGESANGDDLENAVDDHWFAAWKQEEPDVFMTDEEIEAQIAYYEQKFNMTSEEFLERVKQGTAPDEEGVISWKLLLKYR